jgi:hypothetical protein
MMAGTAEPSGEIPSPRDAPRTLGGFVPAIPLVQGLRVVEVKVGRRCLLCFNVQTVQCGSVRMACGQELFRPAGVPDLEVGGWSFAMRQDARVVPRRNRALLPHRRVGEVSWRGAVGRARPASGQRFFSEIRRRLLTLPASHDLEAAASFSMLSCTHALKQPRPRLRLLDFVFGRFRDWDLTTAITNTGFRTSKALLYGQADGPFLGLLDVGIFLDCSVVVCQLYHGLEQ